MGYSDPSPALQNVRATEIYATDGDKRLKRTYGHLPQQQSNLENILVIGVGDFVQVLASSVIWFRIEELR